jgi:hypothetical protein
MPARQDAADIEVLERSGGKDGKDGKGGKGGKEKWRAIGQQCDLSSLPSFPPFPLGAIAVG